MAGSGVRVVNLRNDLKDKDNYFDVDHNNDGKVGKDRAEADARYKEAATQLPFILGGCECIAYSYHDAESGEDYEWNQYLLVTWYKPEPAVRYGRYNVFKMRYAVNDDSFVYGSLICNYPGRLGGYKFENREQALRHAIGTWGYKTFPEDGEVKCYLGKLFVNYCW
jgi:hypothetical protein